MSKITEPSNYLIRKLLVDIAALDVWQMEVTRNRGPAIKKFWPATSYPEGYVNREPYCAAAVAYWVQQWLRDPLVVQAMGMSPSQLDRWRCKSARAFDWLDWAKKGKLRIFGESEYEDVKLGDLMVFDMSHIGIVTGRLGKNILTIEANTGEQGTRDGEGIFRKSRPYTLAKAFISLLP
jgi:hypothetical protein